MTFEKRLQDENEVVHAKFISKKAILFLKIKEICHALQKNTKRLLTYGMHEYLLIFPFLMIDFVLILIKVSR